MELAEVVLDASALLAMLHGEPGGEEVERRLSSATISSVNWAEVLQKTIARGVVTEGLGDDLAALGLTILPFTPEDAEVAAALWPATRTLGLSLGDRACLALALRLRVPAVTADRAWARLDLDVPIEVVR